MEEPMFKRCCCCIPLRYGLLVWGYLKVALSAVMVIILLMSTVPFVAMNWSYGTEALLPVLLPFITILLFIMDIAFTIMFLVGAHKKNPKLMRLYYIYAIVITVLFALINIVTSSLDFKAVSYFAATDTSEDSRVFVNDLILVTIAGIIGAIIFICLQTYFILLIKSEFIKLNNKSVLRFTNNATEAQCQFEKGTHESDETLTPKYVPAPDTEYSNQGNAVTYDTTLYPRVV